MSNTITRSDLGQAVFRTVGLSQSESNHLVEQVLEELADALDRGEVVKISTFGTLSVRQKAERIGRNPKTGQEVPITPRKVLTFRPSNVLRDRVDAGVKATKSDTQSEA